MIACLTKFFETGSFVYLLITGLLMFGLQPEIFVSILKSSYYKVSDLKFTNYDVVW